MKRLRIVFDFVLIFVVGAILYTTIVGSAVVRNLRKELRRKS